MRGIKQTAYSKFMIWRGYGTNTSRNSQLGHTIKHNNENPTFKAQYELDLIIKRKKTVRILYFQPIRAILEIMARNGKIDGKYINRKIGWKWNDINIEELTHKNDSMWKVNYKKFEDFVKDLEKIRDYRLFYADIKKASPETKKVVTEMLENDEWTMNEKDGYMKIKDLWNEYRMNCIKVKNLEFRICQKETEKIKCEIPIIFNEDKDMHMTKQCNPIKLKKMENEWENLNEDIKITKRKKNRKRKMEKTIVDPKRIRIGNDEMIEKMNELKKLLTDMNRSRNSNENNEDQILDKADQLYQIDQTVYDEEVKEVFRQIVMSRKDGNELPYKIIENELLSGQNYLIQMPKMDKIRNNIVGMLQEVNDIKTDKWEANTLADRLQIISGNRMKKVIETNLENIANELLTYKKELEIANDIKNDCEEIEGFSLQKFVQNLKEFNGEANYENRRLHYIERWIQEIEANMDRGMKERENKKENDEKVRIPIEQNPTQQKVSDDDKS